MHTPAAALQVLTNALYFKSTWEYPFDKSRTRGFAFTTSEKEGGKVGYTHWHCGMMHHNPQHS